VKNYIIIFLFAFVITSCKENKKETDSTAVENKLTTQDIDYPVIKVGK